MKESEIAVRTQATQLAEPIAHILDSIIFGNVKDDWLLLVKRYYLNINAPRPFLQLPDLFIVLNIMEEVSPQLYLRSAQYGEGFTFLPLCEVRALEPAESNCLRHTDPAFIGCAGELIEVMWKGEEVKEGSGVALDKGMIEEALEDLADDEFACFDGLRLVTVEPTLAQ